MNMLSRFLMALFLFTGAAAASPANDGVAFVTLLSGAKYQDATQHFTEQMKQSLSAANLETAWHGAADKMGAFKSVGETKSADTQGYTVVYVKAMFEKGAFWVQVAYNGKGEIAGLHFLPTSS